MTTKLQHEPQPFTRMFLRDVQRLGQLDDRDELFRRELRRRLLLQALQQTREQTDRTAQMQGTRVTRAPIWARRRRLSGALRVRLACAAAALMLALSGAAGYLRLSAPAPVSAQTVLSRAAVAMRLAPNQAAHLTYRVTVISPAGATPMPAQTTWRTSTKVSGVPAQSASMGTAWTTADVWVQADANGVPTMTSQALAAGHGPRFGDGAHALPTIDHYVQIGRQVYGYDLGNNAISIPGTHDEHPGWMIPNDALAGAGVAQELSALAQRAPGQVQRLPQQTLDGIGVEVIAVNGWTDAPGMRTTFYFDAGSFLLRGFDAVSIDPTYPTPSWQVRLASYATVAATAVPPHTFILNAPADARVEPFRLDPATFVPAFATACHSTLGVQQLEQILAAKRQTLLGACQASAATVTRDELVAALLTPGKDALDAAVAAGQITPALAITALSVQQQWLAAFVTSPGGTPPPQ
jgi:hypothetical protein